MRKTFKKYMALLLAVTLIFLVVPAASPVYAEDVTETQTPVETEAPVDSEIPAESTGPAESVIPTETVAPSQSVAPSESTIPVLCGDADCSGAIEATDALTVLKHVVKIQLIPEHLTEAADVTSDGKIEAVDALMILKYVVKLVPELPWEESIVVVTPKPTASPQTRRNLETINNYVKDNGIIENEGYRYISEVVEWTPEPNKLKQSIPEIVYVEEADDIIFSHTDTYYDFLSGYYLLSNVQFITDGSETEIFCTSGRITEEGEFLPEWEAGTYLFNDQLVRFSEFEWEAYYLAEYQSVQWDSSSTNLTNNAFHAIDEYLKSTFDIGLRDIGYSSYVSKL